MRVRAVLTAVVEYTDDGDAFFYSKGRWPETEQEVLDDYTEVYNDDPDTFWELFDQEHGTLDVKVTKA